MTTWTSDELNKIGTAEELRIASLRSDGKLLKIVTIWVVRVGDDLYVRSVNGRTSAWFRGVQARDEGRIQAGGVEKDVIFMEETGLEINKQIDAAYLTKYRHYPSSVDHINSPEGALSDNQTRATPDGFLIQQIVRILESRRSTLCLR